MTHVGYGGNFIQPFVGNLVVIVAVEEFQKLA